MYKGLALLAPFDSDTGLSQAQIPEGSAAASAMTIAEYDWKPPVISYTYIFSDVEIGPCWLGLS